MLATDSGAGNAPAQESRYLPDTKSICHALLNLMISLWEKRVPVGMSLRKGALGQKLFNRGICFETNVRVDGAGGCTTMHGRSTTFSSP